MPIPEIFEFTQLCIVQYVRTVQRIAKVHERAREVEKSTQLTNFKGTREASRQ